MAATARPLAGRPIRPLPDAAKRPQDPSLPVTAARADYTPPPRGVDRVEHQVWRSVDKMRRLSDRVVGVGPFGIGLDGIVAFIPGVSTVYSGAAGAYLVVQALRSGASPLTVMRMLGYLGVDTATSAVPVVGQAVDFLFPGHMMAAGALLKDIEGRHGKPHDVRAREAAKKKRRGLF